MKRFLFLLAGLFSLTAGADGADTTFSYQIQGSQSCPIVNDCITPGASGENVVAPSTGIDILAGTFTHQSTGTDWWECSYPWNAILKLTDHASGFSVEHPISGTFEINTWNARVRLSSASVDILNRRYTLTTGPSGDGSKRPFYIRVMVRDLTLRRPVFSTQPGTGPAGEPLLPQPVVTILRPDGSIATDYSGMITLLPRTSINAQFTLTGTTSVQAVQGVARFENVGIDRTGEFTILADAEGLSAVESEPVITTLPLGPNPSISYRTTGSYAYTNRSGNLTVYQTGGGFGNQYIPPEGASVRMGTLTHDGYGTELDAFAAPWTMAIELKDEASREIVTTTLRGVLTDGGRCMYGVVPITATLHPQTVTAGGKRYTFANTAVIGYPHMECDPLDFNVGVRYNPPTQSAPVFAVQPGTQGLDRTLNPQPVVEMRKPDGTLDTSFSGDVQLLIREETVPENTSMIGGYRKVKAVNGVATFSGLTFTKPAEGAVLTAFATSYPVVDTLPFHVGTEPIFADVVRVLRDAGGLSVSPMAMPRADLMEAARLARTVAGL